MAGRMALRGHLRPERGFVQDLFFGGQVGEGRGGAGEWSGGALGGGGYIHEEGLLGGGGKTQAKLNQTSGAQAGGVCLTFPSRNQGHEDAGQDTLNNHCD